MEDNIITESGFMRKSLDNKCDNRDNIINAEIALRITKTILLSESDFIDLEYLMNIRNIPPEVHEDGKGRYYYYGSFWEREEMIKND